MKKIILIAFSILTLFTKQISFGQIGTATAVPTSFSNCTTCVGTATWIGTYLYTNTVGTLSKPLYLTNFNFNIPLTATIVGVQFTASTYTQNSYHFKDSVVKLLINNSEMGLNKALNQNFPPVGITVYGGSTDLWGCTLTPSDINDPTFGVSFSIKQTFTFTPTAFLMTGTSPSTYPEIKIFYNDLATDIKSSGSINTEFGCYYLNQQLILKKKENTTAQIFDVKLMDVLGKTILSEKINLNGSDTYNIDINNSVTGLYYLMITDEFDHSQTRKILID